MSSHGRTPARILEAPTLAPVLVSDQSSLSRAERRHGKSTNANILSRAANSSGRVNSREDRGLKKTVNLDDIEHLA